MKLNIALLVSLNLYLSTLLIRMDVTPTPLFIYPTLPTKEIKNDPKPILSPTSIDFSGYPNPEIAKYICDKFGKDCKIALAVAMGESHMNCKHIGDKNLTPSSYGVFQIRAFKGRPEPLDLLDCYKNIDYAKAMFDRQEWQPWSAYTNKSYEKFLTLLTN